MKKVSSLILSVVMLITLIHPTVSMAEATYSNYDIIKEVALAYDRQAEQIPYDQYYARRSIYASPEDATAQKTFYLDCSSYANAIYREAFGVNVMPYEITANNKDTTSSENGSSLNISSPSTKNFDAYARDNQSSVDVIGYWAPQTYTTDSERQAVVDWIYENIEIGDVIVYRHGPTSGTKGHVYIYMGDGQYIHCAGAGSYTVNEENPLLSYDNSAYEITQGGTIDMIDADSIFKDTTHKRYIFKATADDTVWNFGIIRPLARNLTPTEETLNRMKIAGLSMEKTSSVWENNSVNTNDILTYTVTMENTNTTALNGVTITDTLPSGTEFVSGDSGVTVNGSSLSWTGNIPAQTTVNVSYSVKITATAGARIKSDATYVSGVKLGNITHTVSGYSKSQRALIAEEAIKNVNSGENYANALDMAKDVYKTAVGVDIFDYTTIGEALDDLIDEANLKANTTTDISKTIAPNMYGGLDIRYGRLYDESEKDRISLPMEEHLTVGDIILADWSGGSVAYLYVGDKKLVTTTGSAVWATDASLNGGYPYLRAFSLSATEASGFNGTAATAYAGGSGTTADPYQISNAAELKYAQEMIASGGHQDKRFILTADIDFNNQEWTPLGRENRPFNGSFNGNGHKISNLKITSTTTNLDAHLGFFGWTGKATNVSDLGLENITIAPASWTSDVYSMGGMVASAAGTFERCYVKGATLTPALLNGGRNGAGGFAGYIHDKATFKDCYVYGSSLRNDHDGHVGGFFGRTTATAELEISFENCYVADVTMPANASYSKSDRDPLIYAFGYSGLSDADLTVTNCYSTWQDKYTAYAWGDRKCKYTSKVIASVADMTELSVGTQQASKNSIVNAMLSTDSGKGAILTIGNNIYGEEQDNIIISLLGYDRYAVIRPTMASAPTVDIESIKITTPPSKLEYQSGESFDATGMTVTATMTDGSRREIEGYTVTPTALSYPQNSVTVEFGGFTDTLDVTVVKNPEIKSVTEVSALEVGTTVTVEGVVVGSMKDATNDDEELLIKDIENDTVIAVRKIPAKYGTYPSFGYEKGDRIVFKATIDEETKTNYADKGANQPPFCNSKKYLHFSSENGTKASTIIAKDYDITYNFDNITTISTWDEMKKFFDTNTAEPYKYIKITGDFWFNQYKATDTINVRVHKNSEAAASADIKGGNANIVLREDLMSYHLGQNWRNLFVNGFSEISSGTQSYPGTKVTGKAFYALYCGGKNNNTQLVILDESWIYDNKFEVLGFNGDTDKAQINISEAGTYKVLFVDYENKRFKNVYIETITVKANELGKMYIEKLDKTFTLGTDDKVLIWKETVTPVCAEFIIK